MMATNEMCPVAIEPTDRRYVLFQACSTFMGNIQHFNALHAACQNPAVAKKFYDFLMRRDLSKYGGGECAFQNSRPLTNVYRQAQARSMDSVYLFASWCVNKEIGGNEGEQHSAKRVCCRYTGKDLFDHFKMFARNECLPCNKIGSKDFAHKFLEMDGVIKKRFNDAIRYTLDLPRIKAFLQAQCSYDAGIGCV
jgi:hypothetical protein